MMSGRAHPSEQPTLKHVLSGVWPIPSSDQLKYFSSVEEIKAAVLERHTGNRYSEICSFYTYRNPPVTSISGAVELVGYADRDVVSSQMKSLDKIVFGVKRGDGEYPKKLKLQPRDIKNSNRFSTLMGFLYKRDFTAVIKLDKMGQTVGFLFQWDEINDPISSGSRGSYAGVCVSTSSNKLVISSNGDSTLSAIPNEEKDDVQLWKPGTDTEEESNLWKPQGMESADSDVMHSAFAPKSFDASMMMPMNESSIDIGTKRKRSNSDGLNEKDDGFHKDSGAEAANVFYSNLTRKLETRTDSRLFHMRAFNGWVKATQIAELNSNTVTRKQKKGFRILDLACGKGGDLGKFSLLARGVSNYVGIDVAQGSLRDAAKRVSALPPGKLKKASFICADLGSDVPGKKKFLLETWIMNSATVLQEEPRFTKMRGGGMSPNDRFDVVSIQFAIHYMMSTAERARRFFKTVGKLLDEGGTLIATTIDARIVCHHIMRLGLDINNLDDNGSPIIVSVGEGACQLKFEPRIVKRLFGVNVSSEDEADSQFGLQYTFTLSEGDDHAAGFGSAVDLPEWLTPVPIIESIANEAGLRLDSNENFHEFYANRQNAKDHPMAHNALYNMKVLNRSGSISKQEWDISRMYAAIKFTKVTKSRMESDDDDELDGEQSKPRKIATGNVAAKAMRLAREEVGLERWGSLSLLERNKLMKGHLTKLQLQNKS